MKKKLILIVDDEPDILRFAMFSLEKHGYDVLTATNGQEAIELARDKKPDLVLMDIVLKGEMDGIEAAKQIRSYFNIPIIYLTAHTDDEKLARAKVTAPFGYIAKPFEDRELKFAIEIGLYKAETDTSKEKIEQPAFFGHVLVAEDVETNQVLTKLLLNGMGLEVTIAADGNEAVQKALTRKFDLVFMDIQMPNRNGYEATEALRKEGITTPIIALTANAMKGDDQKCIEVGCDDYLAKPLDRHQLLDKIHKYLPSENQALIEPIDSTKSQVDELANLCSVRTPHESVSKEIACTEVSEEIINWDQLIDRLGDEEIIKEVVPIFLKDNTERLERLTEMVKVIMQRKLDSMPMR